MSRSGYRSKIGQLRRMAVAAITFLTLAMPAWAAFVHPGCLSTQADLDRMAAKVAANEEPWMSGYDRLVGNTDWMLDDLPEAKETIYVQSALSGDNYAALMYDSHKAYQCALRYNVSGETNFADKAVEIMNAWANTHTNWDGNSNVQLRCGLYGHAFACAGELMRSYDGWDTNDFTAFQKYMHDQFYILNKGYLIYHNYTCDTHYWANWELAAMDSALAIGVLCDGLSDTNYPSGQEMFDFAVDYYYNGAGNGNISNLIYYVHPNGLAQWQEIGRDQGHASMGPPQLGQFCEIAWNQGIDLYGELENAFLSTCEHIAKHNLYYDVPYVTHVQCDYWVSPKIGPGQGFIRAGYEMIYNHYVNRMGMSAPYSQEAAEKMRPEGGGFNYGWLSGGFDQIGFGTLTHSLDPIAATNHVPGFLRPHVKGSVVTLSWRGTPYAESYNVKRATSIGGPYTTVAEVGHQNTYYVDPGLVSGTTYYYVVSANNPGGESADSTEAAATPDTQLYGTVIGTGGSRGEYGLTKECVFDGSLRNFFDAPPSVDVAWAGLDLGEGVSAVITQVKYCPRPGEADRMVGGKFQGSDTADFSSGVTDLFTISSEPAEGVLTTQTISDGTAFRYVRYLSPSGGYGNVAEVQFFGNVSGLTAPAAPEVNVSTDSGYQINLTWDADPDAISYNVKRATTSGGPYVILENVTGTSFTDKKLPGDTTYYYVVSALNSAGESADSSEHSASTHPSGSALIAHFKFDGNATDSSGYGYHAAALGNPSFTPRSSGQAIVLDGVDDWVRVDSTIEMENDYTVSMWFQTSTSAQGVLFNCDVNGGHGIMLQLETDGRMRALHRYPFGTSGGTDLYSPDAVNDGAWHILTLVNSGTNLLMYLDGLQVTSGTVSQFPASSMDVVMGNLLGSPGSRDYDGLLDDVRIYNYALSSSEVTVLASTWPTDTTPPAAPTGLVATAGDGSVTLDWTDNAESDLFSYTVYRSETTGGPYDVLVSDLTDSEYADETLSNGLTYYYVVTATDTTLNESANSSEASATTYSSFIPALVAQYNFNGNTLDASGNGHDATPIGSPAYTNGQIGLSIDLDGASDRLTLPAEVANLDDMTIATWVYWNGGNTFQRIFDFGNNTTSYMYLSPRAGGGRMRFAITHSGNTAEKAIEASSALFTNQWVHVAVTLDGDTATLYVDGAVEKTSTGVTIDPSYFSPTVNYIGDSQWSADPLFDGQFDDFRIYNYALSATEVSALATPPAPDATPPAAPTGLAATEDNGNIALEWDDNADPDLVGYNVYRDTASGGPYTQIATGVVSSAYQDRSVVNGTTYFYVVTAVDASGNESDSSNEDSVASYAWTYIDSIDDTQHPSNVNFNTYLDPATTATAFTAATDDGTSAWRYRDSGPGIPAWDGNCYQGRSGEGDGALYTHIDTGAAGTYSIKLYGVWAEHSDWTLQYSIDGGTNWSADVAKETISAVDGTDGQGWVDNSTELGESASLSAEARGNLIIGNVTTTDGHIFIGVRHGSGDRAEYDGLAYKKTVQVDVTPPAAPTGLSATSGDGSVALAWDDNAESDLMSYTVYRSTTSGSGYTSIAFGLTNSLYADSAVTNGTTYYYVVTAIDSAANESDTSAEVSATPQVDPPSAPTGLGATAVSASQIDLSWTASSGATGYNVKRASATGGPYTTIATGVTGTSHSDTGLAESTTYYYVVSAVNTGGESDDSTEASATTQTAPPAAPTGLGASAASSSQIDLSWTASTGATSYNVKRASATGGPYTTIATGMTGTSYSDTGLSESTTYYYVVSAVNTGGESADSTEASATTQPAPPAAPTGLGATAVSASRIDLSWTASTNAASYNVKRAAVDGGPYTTVTNVSVTSWSDTGLAEGTTYYYVVSALNAGGESADSSQIAAETLYNVALNCSASASSEKATEPASNAFDGLTSTKWYNENGGSTGWLQADIGSGYEAVVIRYELSSANDVPGRDPKDWELLASNDGSSWTTLDTRTGEVFAVRYQTNPYSISNSTAYRYYRLNITANNGDASSIQLSELALLSPDAPVNPPAAAPTGLAATAGDGSVSLDWDDNAESDLASYTVYRSTTSGSGYAAIASGLTNSLYADSAVTNGTAYYYVVTAIDTASNESDNSTEASATPQVAAPSAPTGLGATAVSSSQIDLSWTASTGADSYNVKRASTTGGPYTTVATNVTGTSYSDTGLAESTTYYYVVSAVNAGGESVDSSEASATTQTAPPSAPTGLGATAASTSQIDLSWTASTGADSYNVKRASTGGGPYTTVATGVTITSHSDTGLSESTTYYYVVSAVNAGGESADSTEVSATTQTAPPAAPTGLAATAGDGSVSLDWDDNTESDLASYTVYRSTTGGSGYAAISTGVGTSAYVDNTVVNGTTYYYVVTAIDVASNESATSVEVSATPQVAVPSAPTGLTALAVSINQIDLSWTASSGATGYNVKWAADTGGPYTNIVSGLSSTNYSDIGMFAGSVNYYVVSAVNAGGESANSAETNAVTPELVAYLTFDESTGTVAADSSPNGFDGTLVNGPVWASGIITNSVLLDGVDDYVSFPTGMVGHVGNCTISSWVYLNSVDTWSRIFDFGSGTATNMFLTPKSGSGTVRFAIKAGGAEQQIDGASALSIGLWTHVAVTWSGNTGILYVDGMAVGTNSTMTLYPAALGDTTQNYIGKSQYPDPYLNGAVDDFQIVGRALSASEVATLATPPADSTAPAAPTGLTATAGDGTVSLDWDDNSESDLYGYTVYRSTTSGSGYAAIAGSLPDSAYTDNSVVNGTTYYYVVTATDTSANESAASSEVSAAPQAPAESLLESNNNGSDKIDIKWDQPGAQSFKHGSSGTYSITKVLIRLSRENGNTSGKNLTVGIGSSINGGTIGSTVSIPISSIPATKGESFQTFTVEFPAAVGPLNEGQTYYINLSSNYGKSVFLQYDPDASYGNGTYYKSGSDDGKDCWFEVWGL